MSWSTPQKLLPEPVDPATKRLSPDIIDHNGRLYIFWGEPSAGNDYLILYWASMDNGGTVTAPKQAELQGKGVVKMASPGTKAVVEYNDTIHLFFAYEGSHSRSYGHIYWDEDGQGVWKQLNDVVVYFRPDKANKPAACVWNDQIHLAVSTFTEVEVLTWNPAKDTWVTVSTVFDYKDHANPAFVVTGDHLRLLYNTTGHFGPNSVSSIFYNDLTGSFSHTTETTTLGSNFIATASLTTFDQAYGVWIGEDNKIQLSVHDRRKGWVGPYPSQHFVLPYLSLAIFNGRLYCAYSDGMSSSNLMLISCATIKVDTYTWMSQLSHAFDNKPVSLLTIPGTHDSTGDRFYGYDFVKIPFVATQSMTIKDQLDAGIRCFDFRVVLEDSILQMYHGPVKLGITFNTVCETLYNWLNTHPGEGLLAFVRKENGGASDEYNFADAIGTCIDKNAKYWITGNAVPTLDQIRGRIQLLRRYKIDASWSANIKQRGIDLSSGWSDNEPKVVIKTSAGVTAYIQDKYNYPQWPVGSEVVRDKLSVFKMAAEAAMADTEPQHLHINFSSATAPPLYTPISIAAGGSYPPLTLFSGCNEAIKTFVKGKYQSHLGCLMMDVPDAPGDLLVALIATNFDQRTVEP